MFTPMQLLTSCALLVASSAVAYPIQSVNVSTNDSITAIAHEASTTAAAAIETAASKAVDADDEAPAAFPMGTAAEGSHTLILGAAAVGDVLLVNVQQELPWYENGVHCRSDGEMLAKAATQAVNSIHDRANLVSSFQTYARDQGSNLDLGGEYNTVTGTITGEGSWSHTDHASGTIQKVYSTEWLVTANNFHWKEGTFYKKCGTHGSWPNKVRYFRGSGTLLFDLTLTALSARTETTPDPENGGFTNTQADCWGFSLFGAGHQPAAPGNLDACAARCAARRDCHGFTRDLQHPATCFLKSEQCVDNLKPSSGFHFYQKNVRTPPYPGYETTHLDCFGFELAPVRQGFSGRECAAWCEAFGPACRGFTTSVNNECWIKGEECLANLGGDDETFVFYRRL